MPKGGFGNLIALPIDRKSSVFIDEKFEPYKDQWEFLSNIVKLSKVSPFISKRRLKLMLGILKNALNNKVSINIVTPPVSDFKDKDRKSLIVKSNIHQKFSIIDEKIVWYGSINLLSYGSAIESIMRLSSVNIANELIYIKELDDDTEELPF